MINKPNILHNTDAFVQPLFFLLLASCFLLLSPALSHALPWSRDMFSQPSIKAQEDLPPPAPKGIVPTTGKMRKIKDRNDSVSLQNPAEPTIRSIEHGRHIFNIYCVLCHGMEGKGDGTVGKKFIPPTDLTSEYVQKKTDGEIFYTISYGGLAVMLSYGSVIPPEERWDLINYIKHVIGKKK